MKNMFNEQQIALIQRMIADAISKQQRQKIIQSDIPPQTIKRRHIEDNVIVFGDSADRPSDGGAVGVYAYFATDTGVLGCWNGTQWLETTLA